MRFTRIETSAKLETMGWVILELITATQTQTATVTAH